MNVKYILLVGLGSFVGGVLRFLMSVIVKQHISIFPFSLFMSTFIVNMMGCVGIGCLYGLASKQLWSMPWILFTCVGIMGGFTTFSAFSFETITMFLNKQIVYAIIYATSSVVAGLFFTYIGFLLVK